MFHLLRNVFTITMRLNNWFLVMFTIFLITMSSFIIHWLEPKTFDSVFTGFWWVMTTITTVGYGDYAPVTITGRVFAVFLYLIGIGLIGVVIGKIVDGFGTFKKRKEEGKLNYLGSGHFVLIGWLDKSKDAIEDLLGANEKNEIVLIDKKLERSPLEYRRFHYIQGDPTKYETLYNANLVKAKAVLIFSPNDVNDPVLADGHTLMIASAIEHFSNQTQTDIYTIVEVMKEHHVHNFQHAKVDEFILTNQLTSNMMVKVAMYQGASQLFRQLLSAKEGADLYAFPNNRQWKTYEDAYTFFRRHGANLIADRNDFGIIRRMAEPLPKEAKLYAICDLDSYKAILSEME